MVLVKMLMEIDPLPMRGSNSSAGALNWFRLVVAEFRPVSLLMIFPRTKDLI